MPRARRSHVARVALITLLVLPLYGLIECEPPNPCSGKANYTACNKAGQGDGWCISGKCQDPGQCFAGKCDDGNVCTDDFCDPSDGTCTNPVTAALSPECDTGDGYPAACVEDVCVSFQVDPCVRKGSGRVNCCAPEHCGSTFNFPEPAAALFGAYATTCPNPMTSGDCDPTGIEAPGASPNQAGHCNTQGECVYDSGPCANTPCANAIDCTREWCDTATGDCKSEAVPGYGCGNGDVCVYGECVAPFGCNGTSGTGTQCCNGSCNGLGFCEAGFEEEGYYCDPNSVVGSQIGTSQFDDSLPGRCSAIPSEWSPTNLLTKCIPQACAIDDPLDPGGWIEIDCKDNDECTADSCDPDTGLCLNVPVTDNTDCDAGTGAGTGVCLAGTCQPRPDACVGAATCYPCTEQGIRDAVLAGGGPHKFACTEPTTVTMTAGTLFIGADVVLDGMGYLTIQGDGFSRLVEVSMGVTAELKAMVLTRGLDIVGTGTGGILNDGALTLTDVRMTDCHGFESGGGPITNNDTLVVVRSMLVGNSGISGSGAISNHGTLTIALSYLVGNTTSLSMGPLSEGGALNNTGTATVRDTTISGNSARDGGGGIKNTGTLTLTRANILNNSVTAGEGGGISNTGDLTMTYSVIAGNDASNGEGGGIHVGSGGDATVADASSILDNVASGPGGGIRVFRGALVVRDSTLDGNQAGTVGGGISSYGDTSGTTTVDVERSTVSGNIAADEGGGIESQWSRNTLTVTESAIIGNASWGGGGLYVQDGAVADIINSTIALNSTTFEGGGLRVNDANTVVNITHCSFAENATGTSGEAIALVSGQVNIENTMVVNTCYSGLTSNGGNIEAGSDTCGFSSAGDALLAPATLNLSPLGLNGGATMNYLPGPGSTAIDFVACLAGIPNEQRGINARPQGAACDCGAVEAP